MTCIQWFGFWRCCLFFEDLIAVVLVSEAWVILWAESAVMENFDYISLSHLFGLKISGQYLFQFFYSPVNIWFFWGFEISFKEDAKDLAPLRNSLRHVTV